MNASQYIYDNYWFQVEEGVDEETAHEMALWNQELNPEIELNFDEDKNPWV